MNRFSKYFTLAADAYSVEPENLRHAINGMLSRTVTLAGLKNAEAEIRLEDGTRAVIPVAVELSLRDEAHAERINVLIDALEGTLYQADASELLRALLEAPQDITEFL
jgi:hypothetical protein